MQMASSQPKAPNLARLLSYIRKSAWQHVSANFTGFARREFESALDKLDEDGRAYPNLQKLVTDAELGRFTNTKEIVDNAEADLDDLQRRLADLEYAKKMKSPRNNAMNLYPQNPNSHLSKAGHQTERPGPGRRDSRDVYSPVKLGHQTERPGSDRRDTRDVYSPQKRVTYTPDKHGAYSPQNKRDTYTPDKRDTLSPPNKRDIYSPDKRNRAQASPTKNVNRDTFSPDKATLSPGRDEYGYQKAGRHEVAERGPRSPIKTDPNFYDLRIDVHKENFDSLRLKSPEKAHEPSQDVSDIPPQGSRPIKHSIINAKDQSTSASALWGREHGDSNSEKAADSTYRSSFPGHNVDNMERQDKNMYRQNFSSLNERSSWARMENETGAQDKRSRPGSNRSRESTPDRRPPMELIMQFKDLYNTEWKDAYDETCSVFGGPEKTARHLLWVVTEAWLISIDVARKQMNDLQNNSERIMELPGPLSSASRDHVTGYRGRDIGEALPKSKTLLIQYRKQTAPLSIPYVRETCRDKISRTLLESVNFPKSYLNDASRLVAYIYRCAELTWMLCVQEPPVILEYITKDTEGARFNKDHYVEYGRAGTLYDYGVWPLLRHGKNGPILWKGVAAAI